MAITRKVNSGIEITETCGDEDVFPCSPTQGEVRHVGEMRATTKVSRTSRRLTFFSKPIPRRKNPLSLWLAFPPLRRWKAPQPLHKLHEGEARASSQSSTKRSPEHQPPSQLGGHPPRVTSSRSLTRTNRNGELNTYARMQKQEHQGCSNPSHSNPTKATNAMEELERKNKGRNQQMTLRSRSQEFPSFRGGNDWWRL